MTSSVDRGIVPGQQTGIHAAVNDTDFWEIVDDDVTAFRDTSAARVSHTLRAPPEAPHPPVLDASASRATPETATFQTSGDDVSFGVPAAISDI